MSGSKYPEENPRSLKPKQRQQEQLSQDLEAFYNSSDFSDVQVVSEGRVFDCHQVILSARSPVFKAMLQADMAEAKDKKVGPLEIIQFDEL